MPELGAIRLAWWRERLDELDQGVAPPAEPRLQAVAAHLIPAGVKGAELSRLEDCWLQLLTPYPWGDPEVDAVANRGSILFAIAARLLGGEPAEAEPFGALWSLADAASGVSDEQSRVVLRARAQSALAELPRERPAKLLPLTMIATRRSYDLFHGHHGPWHRLMFVLHETWLQLRRA